MLVERNDARAIDESSPSEHDPLTPTQATLPPLAVSALMVRKADLIAALRVYLPGLSDIEAIDQDRFLLSIGAQPAEDGAR